MSGRSARRVVSLRSSTACEAELTLPFGRYLQAGSGGVGVGEVTPAVATAKEVRRRFAVRGESLQGARGVGGPQRLDRVRVRSQLIPSDPPKESSGVTAVVQPMLLLPT